MTHRCIQVKELGELLDLGPDNPRRKHLDECPRCRALMTEYRGFLDPPEEVEGADPHDAKKRLSAFLNRKILQNGKPGRFFERTSFRLLMAAAAVVFAALSLFTWMDTKPQVSDDIVLREGAGDPGKERKITLLPVADRADHRTELRWTEVEGADAYTVRLFSVELEELAVLGPVTEPYHVLNPEEIPIPIEPGKVLLWRVHALKEGDAIAASPIGSFKAP